MTMNIKQNRARLFCLAWLAMAAYRVAGVCPATTFDTQSPAVRCPFQKSKKSVWFSLFVVDTVLLLSAPTLCACFYVVQLSATDVFARSSSQVTMDTVPDQLEWLVTPDKVSW
jgi:hypothetical protein